MTKENKKGAALDLLPPNYQRDQNECVQMILIRDYAGYCFAEDTRQTLIFNGAPCKTWTDLQAVQNKLPDLTAKGIISESDAALCSTAVKEYKKCEPDAEKIYSTFRNMEMAAIRLRDMIRVHSDHLPEETRRPVNGIVNAAGLAVRGIKQKSEITIQTLRGITDIYSLLLLACPAVGLWDGGRPGGIIGDFVSRGPDPFGFPRIDQLYKWAEEFKLVSLPPEVFAADFDEYAAAVSRALTDLTGYKTGLVLTGQKWPQPDTVESYLDDLINIPSLTSYTARNYLEANDTISNHLTSQTKRLKIGKETRIPDSYRQATKTVTIPTTLESELKLSQSITEYDRAVYNSVYSLIDAGNAVVTAAMIYRVMTGKKDGEAAPPGQLKKIETSMEKAGIIRVTADLTKAAAARGLKEIKGRPIKEGQKIEIRSNLIPNTSIAAEVKGKPVIAYKILDIPPLYAWAKATRQITTMPADVMDVKKVRGGRISGQSVNTNETRTAVKSYLLRQLAAIHERAELTEAVQVKARRKKAGKKEDGPYIGRIRYDSVFQAAGVDWDSLPRQLKERHRKFIRACLENWQNDPALSFNGFVFEEYKEKNKIIGLLITYLQD